jgi:hypothetical protein
MEATSDYWKPVFYLLEARGFEAWLDPIGHIAGTGDYLRGSSSRG